jgi:superoxide dismutase, Cu-Zn family
MRALTLAAVLCVLGAAPAVAAEFEPYRPGAEAVTYDPRVPAGARASVMALPIGGRTVVVLLVSGLPPHAHHGAHVHVRPCGPAPADAGPHFQDVVDPVQPSVDPAYANPRNEVWLDFTADASGTALSSAVVEWTFDGRQADSVVLHEHHTQPGGGAGARLACLRLP